MVEQNKSPPTTIGENDYWMAEVEKTRRVTDPDRAFRLHTTAVVAIALASVVAVPYFSQKNRQKEQKSIQFFLEHRKGSETPVAGDRSRDDIGSAKNDLSSVKSDIESMRNDLTEIKKALSHKRPHP